MMFLPFRIVLERHLVARQLSLRGFARAVNVPVSLLTKLKNGERSVPMTRIAVWADHLGLHGRERSEFIDSAMWTTVPQRLRPWFEAKLATRKSGVRGR